MDVWSLVMVPVRSLAVAYTALYVSSSSNLSQSSVCTCVYSSVSHPCPPAPLLEHLCSALLYPDEGLKASVLSVWLKLFRAAGGSAVQSLPGAIMNRVCILLLQTLSKASSPLLISSCVGERNTYSLFYSSSK